MDESSAGTSSVASSTNGSENKTGGGLRNFRKDKGQVSLLRFFRNESKKSEESKESKPSSSPVSTTSSIDAKRSSSPVLNSSSSGKTNISSQSPSGNSVKESDEKKSPVFKRKLSAERPMNNFTRTNVMSNTQQTVLKMMVQKPTTTLSVRTLSKPLFVGAPSPEGKEEESPNEAENDESSSESPLGGMSMKTLISKTSPTKRTLNTSDMDDSQDSPLFYARVKRARIVASSDEEDTSDTKKPLVNGHGNASPESSKKPDDDSIDKFINMWEMVYPFVDKMECLDLYKANDWDAKLTMMQLSKISRDRRDKDKIQKAEEELQRKKMAAKKKKVPTATLR